MAENLYIVQRNSIIRDLYCTLRDKGFKARPAMLTIKKELHGELSLERIRKIIYSKNIPPYRNILPS